MGSNLGGEGEGQGLGGAGRGGEAGRDRRQHTSEMVGHEIIKVIIKKR